MGTTKRLTLLLALASLLALPLAVAQETTGEEQQMPDEVDVNIEDNRDETPQEAVGAGDSNGGGDGLGATTMVILVVLGIVVIGLIVALAARRP